jgi:hypothetical protein
MDLVLEPALWLAFWSIGGQRCHLRKLVTRGKILYQYGGEENAFSRACIGL